MAKRNTSSARASSRSAARLAAVQALYQMDMTGIDLNQVIAEFEAHRFGQVIEGSQYADAELDFFRDLVTGVVREQLRIDPLIDKQLAEGWRLTRVDSILRAILRAGAYEILVRGDVPVRVVISEYVDIAHAFFGDEEPKVVNGILDRLGHRSRPQEFAAGGPEMVDGMEPAGGKRLGEFEIIARYFAPLATDAAALGLRDDAAVLRPPESQEIVLSCDTIVEGVHFLKGDPPDSIAHKALAVNLSDLAAKGARPYAYLLALALPEEPSPAWLEAFAAGLRKLQIKAGAALVGGDTTRIPGPLSITVTALGLVPQGHAVLRHGAKRGDLLYVTGTIGDAYLGLHVLKEPTLARDWGFSEEDLAFVIERYRRPLPHSELALIMRNFAQGAIDVSDGLVGDIGKLASVSHAGAVLEAARVPFSPAAQKALGREPQLLQTLLTAGDDYEIVAAVPQASASAFETQAKAKGAPVTMIGRVESAETGLIVLGPDNKALALARGGYAHF